jgi:hypothetical protein
MRLLINRILMFVSRYKLRRAISRCLLAQRLVVLWPANRGGVWTESRVDSLAISRGTIFLKSTHALNFESESYEESDPKR